MTNHDLGGILNGQLNAWILEHMLGLTTPEVQEIRITQKEQKSLAGMYGTGDGMSGLELKFTKSKLMVRAIDNEPPELIANPAPPLPPFTVRSVRDPRRDNDLLEATDGLYKGAKIELLRDANGQVAYLRSSGRLYVRQQDIGVQR